MMQIGSLSPLATRFISVIFYLHPCHHYLSLEQRVLVTDGKICVLFRCPVLLIKEPGLVRELSVKISHF